MRKLTPDEIKKLELVKLRKALQAQLDTCLDADDLESRPAGAQIDFLKDEKSEVIWIVAANRSGKCLAEGTLVATPKGAVKIEDIKVGDTVYNEYGNQIKVLDVFDQGVKEVVDLVHRNIVQATCTVDHIWLVETEHNKVIQRRVKDFAKSDKIIRTELYLPLGSKNVEEAYLLGAMLGDGCCRESRKNSMIISAGSPHIPLALDPNAIKLPSNNYSWKIKAVDSILYNTWCKNKYAHEKYVDMEEVATWNRTSVIKLLAGLIDTDGHIAYHAKYNLLNFSISMQSRSCIDFVQWAIRTLYQYETKISIDNRAKYKNGPCYAIKLRNTHINRRMFKELTPYLNMPNKQYKPEWDAATNPKYNPSKIKVSAVNPRKLRCYDLHVSGDTNLYCLANGLVTHNTASWVRAITWWFAGKHPYITPPKSWGERFNILVVGRTLEIIETELWDKKIKPLLEHGTYEMQKKGGQYLSSVEHSITGNKIIFMSHHDAKNAREKVQGFTAPVVVLDEMPDDSGLVSELIMRTATIKGAKFIGAFTPLVENEQIKKVVDASGTRYTFRPEDNPKLMDRFGGIESYEAWLKAQCATEAEYRARRFGEWYYRTGRVIAAYDPDLHMKKMPHNYHPMTTRHVAVVDPAAVGLVGVTIWAEVGGGHWQCVHAQKVTGNAAYTLVKDLEELYKGFYIVKRVCDCNPAGFYKEAIRQGIDYKPVEDKADRKWETIENVNAALAQGVVFLAEGAQALADECLQAKVSETNGNKIIASSSWHLIDCFRYFIDNIPAPLTTPTVFRNLNHALKQKHLEQQAKQEKYIQIIQQKRNRWNKSWRA